MLKRALLVFLLSFACNLQASPLLLIFGDSLSADYGMSAEAGWVSLLRQRLQQGKYDYQVINLSISGETTRGGRSRIEPALAQHQPALVILELGVNDGLRGLPLEAARDNLDAIIRACRKRGSRVLLVGMRLPPNYGMAYTRKFQQMYRQLAGRHRLPLVPFMLEGVAGRQELLQVDGIHPAAAAQPLILENIWKYLQPMLKNG